MEVLYFENVKSFDNYLRSHIDGDSFWLKISKEDKPKLTADEAVEVALCYGWIDSTNKRIDENHYIKYFAKRRPKSVWSTKNKLTIERLIADHRMHQAGLEAIEIAKKNGCWDKADLPPEDFNIDHFKTLLLDTPKALEHFIHMSNSVQKTYALSYYTLKTLEARARRIKVIIERLEQNLKPM